MDFFAEIGNKILLNEDDQYLGDNIATFVDILVADNDTSSPKKFIQSQHQVIGKPADNKEETFPDLGHTIKITATNSTP